MPGGKFPKDIQLLFNRLYKNKTIPNVKPGSRSMRLGFPVMFVYNAKWKQKLPYWDALPFSIVLAKYPDGFLGLNLHYIQWTTRIQLAKKLVRSSKNGKRIKYIDIKKAFRDLKLPDGLLALVIRRYLYSHIKSNIKIFDIETYGAAVKDIRPNFKKKSEKQVLYAIRELWRMHQQKVRASKRGKK